MISRKIQLNQLPVYPQKFNGREVIEKVENCKRGFGSFTAALFRYHDKWDYLEIVQPGANEYQSSAKALKNPSELLGKTIEQLAYSSDVLILRGKYHKASISNNGEIVELMA